MGKRHYFITKILMVGIIAFCSCNYFFPFNDKDGTGGQDKVPSIIQVPGCARESLSKQADSLIDSCFVYQFGTDLSIEFCVTANCCPDSNRFDLSWQISSDTINIAVQDTAAGLCDCICPYIIRLNLFELPFDKYSVVVVYNDQTAYSEPVIRH